MYVDANNTVYVCDTNNNRIQMWVQGATSGVTVAGSNTTTQGSSSTLLKSPTDMTFDTNGFMYVVDSGNNRVQRFPPNSIIGTTVAGFGSGSAALNNLNNPSAIAVDDNFNLYILDMGNKRVMGLVPNATNATNGTVLISNNNLNNDYGILLAPGSSDQVYLSDHGQHQVYLWTFNASSPVLILSQVNSSQNSMGARGMAFDSYDNLYVADQDNHQVVMYCANSTAGNSTVGIVVAVDNNTPPRIQQPADVAFDSNLNLYVVSVNDNQVVKFSLL